MILTSISISIIRFEMLPYFYSVYFPSNETMCRLTQRGNYLAHYERFNAGIESSLNNESQWSHASKNKKR